VEETQTTRRQFESDREIIRKNLYGSERANPLKIATTSESITPTEGVIYVLIFSLFVLMLAALYSQGQQMKFHSRVRI
jgi:hypothetical protein